MRVLVTGATGFIGRRLTTELLERGDEVVALSRDPERGRGQLPSSVRIVGGDAAERGPWMEVAASCDALVHLAGEPIAGRRWTAARKQRIRSSRIDGARHLVEAMGRPGARAGSLLCASAVGFYGASGDQVLDESSPPGAGFLAEVCQAWEREAARAGELGKRAVELRIGVVLGGGGALAKMAAPFRAFVGGPLGSGRQWVSWIHVADLAALALLALSDSRIVGPLNATSPAPCTMSELAAAFGHALRRPSWLPAPGFALKAVFGEAASVLLEGQRVLPRRALQLGYIFRFPTIDAALEDLFGQAAASAKPATQP